MVYRKDEKDYCCWHQKIKFIEPTHNQPVTVRQVIGNLPPIAAGEKNYSDNLHVTATLSDINIQRIQHSIPGGTWRDWPESLVLDCHKKDSGQMMLLLL